MISSIAELLQFAAQIEPRGVATSFDGRLRSWSELTERVARLSGALLHLGLRPGDRVVLAARDGDRFVEAAFAVAWAGGVLQLLNLRLAQAEIADQFADSGASLVIADLPGWAAIGEAAAGLPRLALDGRPPEGSLSYEQAHAGSAAEYPSPRGGDDMAILAFTGGTTGRAKGVMLSHRNVVSNALIGQAAQRIAGSEICLVSLPMFHIGGLMAVLRGTAVGASHRFLARFDAGTWLDVVARERITRSALAPVMLLAVLDHPNFASTDLSSLRWIVYGTAPMPDGILRRALLALPGVGFYQGYGQTESCGSCVYLGPEWHRLEGSHAAGVRAAARVGQLPDVAILGADGTARPAGEVGEVCIRGDVVMLGYWNRPEETAAALRGSWLHTGDIGWLDPDGFLFIADRLKDMIISGGENVYSIEVEAALLSHPAVSECAVFAVPDETWGERVHAVVRFRDGEHLSADLLKDHCAARIARYKCPRTIAVSSTPLPRSSVGKVLKTELRRPYWSGQVRNVH